MPYWPVRNFPCYSFRYLRKYLMNQNAPDFFQIRKTLIYRTIMKANLIIKPTYLMMQTKNSPRRNSCQFMMLLLLVLLNASTSFAQLASAFNSVNVKRPLYFGYEIGVGVQGYTLKSNISRINNLHVLREGGYAGIKLGGNRVALRANAGLYYSDASVGYSIDHLEGTVSGNIYLLRLGKVKSHMFEPYFVGSVTYQRAKFFGSYLQTEQKNYSYGNERELGSVRWYSGEVGAGIELQLHNDNLQFLHFFAEAKYGSPFSYNSSNVGYSQTFIKAPVALTVGVTFGRIR